MSTLTRRSILGLFGVASVLAAGCTSRPLREARMDGTYCYSLGGRPPQHRKTCTPTAIPPQDAEADAKRFEGRPDVVTLYVIRKRWTDARNVVWLRIDDRTAVATVPETFARLRMTPGPHRLTVTWEGGSAQLDVDGAGGEVKFVELIGSISNTRIGQHYRLQNADPAESRLRATKLRLVGDVA
jgi:hypothetical protein